MIIKSQESNAPMQVVISIDEEIYESLKNGEVMISGLRNEKTFMSKILTAVANGTPLPKGCKRLVSVDDLEECQEIMNTIDGESKYAVRMDDIRNLQIQL